MREILVVCDNTMGIPGKPVDDGLALLYLLGFDDVSIRAICCTHGNSSTENTYAATIKLVQEYGLDVPVVRGADAGSVEPSEAARYIVEASRRGKPIHVLSLGAASDLAAAERLEPGCLARFASIALMGGITHTLRVGGKIMDELNFSVDGQAAYETFAAVRTGARLIVADAWNCLPLTFYMTDFKQRLVDPGYMASDLLQRYCLPWMEYACDAWNTEGFVGWDVLAAIALVRPDLVDLVPFEVTANPRLFTVGLLEKAQDRDLALPVSLIAVRDSHELCEHVYHVWERACKSVGNTARTSE